MTNIRRSVQSRPAVEFRRVGRIAALLIGLVPFALLGIATPVLAQGEAAPSAIDGEVVDASGLPVPGATVTAAPDVGPPILRSTDTSGRFTFGDLGPGRFRVNVEHPAFRETVQVFELNPRERRELRIVLQIVTHTERVEVIGTDSSDTTSFDGIRRVRDVHGTTLLAGKKHDMLMLDQLPANLTIGNTRQVFGKVPGTSTWENDGAGLQVGVSNRGLDPNRSWEMNSRQNGYDITADVFGYPEAYFTPPLEAVERIEVVRGSSSLQFGPQFGGLVNYVLKQAPPDRRLTLVSEQTVGSTALVSSHNRLAGTVGRLAYNTFYQRRQADGWRENSGFDYDAGFGAMNYEVSDRLRIGFEMTGMRYELQMAGGLTDELFAQDARTSIRPGNWFHLKWLVPALKIEYDIDADTRVSTTAYVIDGHRRTVFNSQAPATSAGILNLDDGTRPRTLYNDRFRNYGSETRLAHRFRWFARDHWLATGVRYYHGKTLRQHGLARPGTDPTYEWFAPVQRNLHFTNVNVAGFAELALQVTSRLTVTPGFRLDHIDGHGEGPPIVGESDRSRLLRLGGLGATYRLHDSAEVYGNISQAYRATLFNDLWRPDPAIVVDPDLKDMQGYVGEFGVRGARDGWLSFDVGGFVVGYGDRLGLLASQMPSGETVRLWTNVSDSRNTGLEALVEADVIQLLSGPGARSSLRVFNSTAVIDTRYLEGSLRGNRVEYAPSAIVRSGATYQIGNVSASLQHSFVGDAFSDATNTERSADGILGRVPAYRVWDASGSYRFARHYVLRAGLNNVTDVRYFTRRATGYPGPGLVPADGRRFTITFGVEY